MRTQISLFVLVGALCTACGGESNAPVLSNLALSTSPVVRGQQASGTFRIKDLDGLGDMKLSGKLTGPLSGDVPIATAGLTDVITETDVAFALLLSTQVPAGEYQLKITAEDPDGNKSNEASVTFTAQ